jgi:integrase
MGKLASTRQAPLLADNRNEAPRIPGSRAAGITKRIGWHSSRRRLATLLQLSGASVKTTQELLRHATPGITLAIYAKAVTADKRQAQDAIADLFVGNSNQSADVASTGWEQYVPFGSYTCSRFRCN